MSRRYLPLIAVFLAGLAIAKPTSPGDFASAEQRLIKQIQYGEALYRDDIVEDAVTRLYRISPQHPQGLLAEIRLAVRLGRLEQARERLAVLEGLAPQSETAKEAALLVYLTTDEANEALAQARLFAAAGRLNEARDRYDSLLQGRYPTAELTQEYWRLRARQSGEYALAIKALTQGLQRFDNHPALLKALVDFNFSENQPEPALYYLHQLATSATERDWAANKEYEYIRSLAVSDYSRKLWTDFVERYADIPELNTRAKAQLNAQVRLLSDPSWLAGKKGLQLLEEERDTAQALAKLTQAVQAYPDDVELIGALGLAYLRLNNREQALRYFERALATEKQDDKTSKWISLIDSTKYWLLLNQAAQAERRQDWQQAKRLYQQAYSSDPTEIFALVGLGGAYLETGEPATAWTYYRKAAAIAPTNETAQRGVLRYAQTFPIQDRGSILATTPAAMQRSALFVQARRDYQVEALQIEAQEALQAHQWERAASLLRQAQQLDPDDTWLSYGLATTLRDQGQVQQAFDAFEIHRVRHQKRPSTQYAYGLLLASVERWDEALAALDAIERRAWSEEMVALEQRVQQTQLLERSQALYDAGDRRQAMALLEEEGASSGAKLQLAEWAYDNRMYAKSLANYQEVLQTDTLSPNGYRGLARAWQAVGGDPQQALDWYAQGMVSAQMLSSEALAPERDDVAFTRAMRLEDSDEWLERGLRTSAEKLYQQQNPTLTMHNDHWWRKGGTPGLSALRANTSMVQLDYPIKHGKGFVRLDHVRMDAGTLETNANGVYTGEFGTCGQQGSAGCTDGLKQTAVGTGLAVGWRGDNLAFDIGTTPLGFAVTNWAGGISYSGDIGLTGWRLTASRRPMSNSLLSFAGAQDPPSGAVWGGVMATGVALSLSWDQGEENGVWADISFHGLRGKNVENNSRMRLMGGYYRRLINRNNELLTAGINLMHWQYQKDLGGYSFGQGGYYSPKQYNSVSFPVRYAKRTDNWSFAVYGGASFSATKQHDGSSSNGIGYVFSGVVERRLSNHLVMGAGIDLQHSKDYAPSRAMLYLRYTFEPWQGSLPLGPDPIIPYADYK